MELTTPEELFLEAHRYNWDSGTKGLLRILNDPECDLGTATLIYWKGRPEYYRRYADDADVPDNERASFKFLRDLELRILANEFRPLIRYDPAEEVGLYDRDRNSFVRDLPVRLYEPTPGEIPGADLQAGLRGPMALVTAATLGDADAVRRLLDAGYDVHTCDRNTTPLGAAAYRGHPDCVRLLLEYGADPNVKEGDATPIHNASAWMASRDVVELLLDAGVPVDSKAKYSRTPLHWAAKFASEDVALLLLERGAKPNLRDRHGASAVHDCAAGGSTVILDRLLEHGWEVDATDKSGRNALHYAVRFPGWNDFKKTDRGAVVRRLVGLGVSPDHADNEGKAPRALAADSARSNHLAPLERDVILDVLGIVLD